MPNALGRDVRGGQQEVRRDLDAGSDAVGGLDAADAVEVGTHGRVGTGGLEKELDGECEECGAHHSTIRFGVHYQGGKRRLAPKFAAVLDLALREAGADAVLVEPFVGGFNVVPSLGVRPAQVLCSDAHPGVIALWRAVQAGWRAPESLGEEEYRELRRIKDWSNPLTAFALFGCSYGGKEDGSYARGRAGTSYAAESARGIERKREALSGVSFACKSFQDVVIPPGAVVYCDPPYRGVKGYGGRRFCSDTFFTWCEEIASSGARVFVSELAEGVPGGWRVVWRHVRRVHVGTGRREVVEVLAQPMQ